MKSTESLALEACLLGDETAAAEYMAELLPGERVALRAASLMLTTLAAGSPSLVANLAITG